VIPEAAASSKNEYHEIKIVENKKPPLSLTRANFEKLEPKRNIIVKAETAEMMPNVRDPSLNKIRISQKTKHILFSP
jgi:hypothetical protein